MDYQRAFNQVKGFSLGLLATPAAFLDQFTETEYTYSNRLVAAIGDIPDGGKAGKAGMITSGVVAFAGALALFNAVASGPRIEDLGKPQATKVEARVSQRVEEAKAAPASSGPRSDLR